MLAITLNIEKGFAISIYFERTLKARLFSCVSR